LLGRRAKHGSCAIGDPRRHHLHGIADARHALLTEQRRGAPFRRAAPDAGSAGFGVGSRAPL
jgi:hypothetical protein